MPVLERLRGVRVVADPTALDTARWTGAAVTVLRFAPDDAFAIGATSVEVDDEHAVIEADSGFVGAWFPVAQILPHVEWSIPADRPALVQGSIANVPAKVWLADDGDVLLVTAAAYADELTARLR